MDWNFVFSANMNFPHLSSFPIVIKLFFIRLYASLPLIYILPDNEKCEMEICRLAKIPPEDPISGLKMEIFEKRSVLSDWLLGFVKVRDNKDITASISDLPKRKGKVIEVLSGDIKVLINYACEKQADPILANIDQLEPLRLKMIGEDEDDIAGTSDPSYSSPLVAVLIDSWNISQDFVRNSFEHIGTLSDKDDAFKESMANNLESLNVDLLTSHHLLPRYGSLMTDHLIPYTHFTVRWMETNMSRAAAILKMHGYAKEIKDLEFTLLSDSLLKSSIKCEEFECEDANERSKRIGAYLMKDSVRNQTIRAGSTASSFLNRLVDHGKAALLTNSVSKKSVIYSSYPNE